MGDADRGERPRRRLGLDGDDGDADVLQRADELPVEPRQLGRQHHCTRPLPQRDAEQLAEVDAAAHDVDAELGSLQAAHERRLPGRPARARHDPGRVQRSWLPSKLSRPPPGEPVVRTTSRSALRIANTRNTASSCWDRERERGELALGAAEQALGSHHLDDLGVVDDGQRPRRRRRLREAAQHVDPVAEPHPATERVLGRDRNRDLTALTGSGRDRVLRNQLVRAEREEQHATA